MSTKMRIKKGVSPVIATVILVAVAITVAVAVAYWMSGISAQYTSFEKVEIQSAYATYDDTPLAEKWIITMDLKNTGSADATLISVFINDKPIDQTNILCPQIDPDPAVEAKLPIESGTSVTVTITINDVAAVPYTSGTTLNIKLHSAAGMDYIKLVKLT